MNNRLTTIVISQIKGTFLELTESIIIEEKKKLIKTMTSFDLLAAFGTIFNIFAFEFTFNFIKKFLLEIELNGMIESLLSKLIKEPYSTALRIFKTACELPDQSNEEKNYRESRFKVSLDNFERALSLSEPREKPFIGLFKGLCAFNITGGEGEAIIHFKGFTDYCKEIIPDLKTESEKFEIEIKKSEDKANELEKTVKPVKGLGGGTLIGWDIVASNIEIKSLRQEIEKRKQKIDDLRNLIIDDLRNLINDILECTKYIETFILIAEVRQKEYREKISPNTVISNNKAIQK